MKALLKDWRWILGISLLLVIPTYGFTSPLLYVIIAHIIATLVYAGLLLFFGDGFVIEGALVVLILTILFAFGSRPLHKLFDQKTAMRAEPGRRANSLQCHASCGAGTAPLSVIAHG
jgi:hypothetical protein